MIKKFLNKEEKKIYDLTVRPLIIYSIILLIIIFVGSSLKTLSFETISGYISCYTLYSIIQYINISYCIISQKIIKKEDTTPNTNEDIDVEAKEIQDNEN